MAFRLKNKCGDQIITIIPDVSEYGMVPVSKVYDISNGGWNVVYGGTILKRFASEALANTFLTNFISHLNTVESGSVKTVQEVEALT